MARLLAVFGVLLVLWPWSAAQAATTTPWFERLYGDVHFALSGVRHSETDFYPGFVSLGGGAWLRRGVGIEVFADEGLFADEQGAFELELTSAGGIAARFESPLRHGFFAYVLAGVVQLRLVQDENTALGARSVVQNYQGGRISIGIAQRLGFADNLIIAGEYRNYFVDSELQIDALSLGVRLSFK